MDAFIVNFYCQALRLAIEVDGNSRDYNEAADVARQQRLEQLGIWFLRVTDKEVKTDMGNVLRTITAWLENHGSKTHP